MRSHATRILLCCAALLASPARAAESPEKPPGLEGTWQGALKVGAMSLRLEFTFSKDDKGLSGVLRSLDQGGAKIPLSSVKEEGGKVRVEAAAIGGAFDGAFAKDSSTLDGTWTQGGTGLPLQLKRGAKLEAPRRPQEPKEPFPYAVEQVTIPSAAGVTLAGTFTMPAGAGPHPAVVLLTGSGPQDRDEALMGHRPFLVLADHLTRQGIAVLRCDDRGVGKSTGDFQKATHLDFAEDATAALLWLKSRTGVDARRVGLLGHSEGGVVAPLVASRRPGDVAFVVMLAGVGVPMDELLVRQGSDLARLAGVPEDVIKKKADEQQAMLTGIKQAADDATVQKLVRDRVAAELAAYTPEQRKAMGLTDGAIEGQVRMAASPWFRQLLAYDPHATLRAVKCPVLALNGGKDIQVAAKENIEAISRALGEGGNRRVETQVFPGLNHLFQTCQTGAVTEYATIEETMSPVVLSTVSEWIKQQAAR